MSQAPRRNSNGTRPGEITLSRDSSTDGIANGTARELEGVPTAVARFVPYSALSSNFRARENSIQSAEQKNRNRIKLQRVDAETGEPVEYEDIVKGYEVGKGQYIEITDEELEAIALESTRTIDIDEFVPKEEIDDLFNVRPYYITPEGKVGTDAFAVIRDVIGAMDKVALGRVVLTSREHVIAIEPRDKGLMGTLLRYPYEVRQPAEYFQEIPETKITKDMLDLAKHIVQTKSGHFDPEKFEDHYEEALKELLAKKQAGEKITAAAERKPAKVVDLMDALRKSVEAERAASSAGPKRRGSETEPKPKRTRRAS
jgi:DNA end-binding protein Ku